ncbi:MAG: ABC transporter permease [Clostridiales bacterium]|nr:ABC transporter permease [Clostridiales bacterium]
MMEKSAVNGLEHNQTLKKENQVIAVLKRMRRNKGAMVGLAVFLFIVIVGILAPWLAPYPYDQIDMASAFQSPSLKHLMGTDNMGRDVLSRIMYGVRYSVTIGVVAMIISFLGGTLIGAVAGFYGGKTDQVIMRLCDIVQAIPSLILNIALATVLGEGFVNCIIALGIGGIAGAARLVRSSMLSIRKMEYLDAAKVINCPTPQIIGFQALPNAISPMIVQATMSVARNILNAASLSYLGLGVQPPNPEWGAMLTAGRDYISKYPYLTIIPGLVIIITALSLNLLGDGLRDAMDPKLKK